MTEIADIIITRAIIKTKPEIRTEILKTVSECLRKHGFEVKYEFLKKITLATADEVDTARAHVVELDWKPNHD